MGNIGYVRAELGIQPATFDAPAFASYEHQTEEWSQARFAQFMGKVSLARTIEAPKFTEQATLLSALQDVAKGEEANSEQYKNSMTRLEVNIHSTVSEIVNKRGHITRVAMQSESDDLIQHGQSLTQIHFNSLVFRRQLHPVLEQITETEALNNFRIRTLKQAGVLKDHFFIVPSLIPRNVPEEYLDERGAGYFLRTMSAAYQGTTEENGEVVTETTFMAGVDEKYENASFEERMAHRHDLVAVQQVCRALGLEPPKTEQQALHGFLVHKSQLPHGMIDFMRMCDLATDRLHGRIVPRPIEQYQKLAQQSQDRDARLKPAREAIKAALLKRAGSFSDPNELIATLWEEARVQAAWATFYNHDLDVQSGGEGAAVLIAEARQKALEGHNAAAQQLMKRAVKEYVATGCGGGASAKTTSDTASFWKKFPDDLLVEEKNNDEDYELPEKLWRYTKGICQVTSCASRSRNDGTTWVGPCEVCRSCKRMFDKGLDPTKFSAIERKPKSDVDIQKLMQDLGLYLLKPVS